ncbi:unnamed protein product [Lampetra fluviatilis]
MGTRERLDGGEGPGGGGSPGLEFGGTLACDTGHRLSHSPRVDRNSTHNDPGGRRAPNPRVNSRNPERSRLRNNLTHWSARSAPPLRQRADLERTCSPGGHGEGSEQPGETERQILQAHGWARLLGSRLGPALAAEMSVTVGGARLLHEEEEEETQELTGRGPHTRPWWTVVRSPIRTLDERQDRRWRARYGRAGPLPRSRSFVQRGWNRGSLFELQEQQRRRLVQNKLRALAKAENGEDAARWRGRRRPEPRRALADKSARPPVWPTGAGVGGGGGGRPPCPSGATLDGRSGRRVD